MKKKESQPASWRNLPRNIWAVSITSFLTDISTEMVINLLPLYLLNVLGVSTAVIGLIEGVAEALASLLNWCAAGPYRRSFLIHLATQHSRIRRVG